MSRKELSASPSARLITLTSTLIILHITKTSSNNCLIIEITDTCKILFFVQGKAVTKRPVTKVRTVFQRVVISKCDTILSMYTSCTYGIQLLR